MAKGKKHKRGEEYKLLDPPQIGAPQANIDYVEANYYRSKSKKALEKDGKKYVLSIWSEIDFTHSYFKCQQCDQTCQSCRGEKATGGTGSDPEEMFKKIGWNEDKSQCLQPCPDGENGTTKLPYFIREKKLDEKELKEKRTRDSARAEKLGREYIPPVPNPHEHRQSCLAVCTAQYYTMWKDDPKYRAAGYRKGYSECGLCQAPCATCRKCWPGEEEKEEKEYKIIEKNGKEKIIKKTLDNCH